MLHILDTLQHHDGAAYLACLIVSELSLVNYDLGGWGGCDGWQMHRLYKIARAKDIMHI